jgi:FkbM family methyltransferase
VFRNLRTLIAHIRRESARQFLYEQAGLHLQSRPQLCGYAFERIFIDIEVDGRCDDEMLDVLLDLVDIDDRNVVDVGANIGNHTLAFAQKAAHVFTFEPHPITYRLLQLNIGGRNNVTAYNRGASNQTGTLRAVSPRSNFGATAISDRPLGEGELEFTFNLVDLDSVPELRDIALVKIDVEGHEIQALQGARQLIAREKPIVVIEQNQDQIRNGRSQCYDLLQELGYSNFYSIDRHLPWRTPQRLPRRLRSVVRGMEALLSARRGGRLRCG